MKTEKSTFNILFTLISSPSLFDFDAISDYDLEERITHAFKLATTSYAVPPLFEAKGKKNERHNSSLQ